MADDVAVESDSGGHTDNRPLHVVFPLIKAMARRIARECGFPSPVRVGAGGGIGCPEAVCSAFNLGADFVVTGSVNQLARQSGSSDYVRKALADAAYSDVTMAPAADMFDQGVELQVLKRGTMFPSRAKKLYELFKEYNSLNDIPADTLKRLEKTTFRKPVEEVWAETKAFYLTRLNDPDKVARAERDPKTKMSMVFRWCVSRGRGQRLGPVGGTAEWETGLLAQQWWRSDATAVDQPRSHRTTHIVTQTNNCSPPPPPPLFQPHAHNRYLSKSSGWANRGDAGRESDYQIWCGPCIGSFNEFIRGSYLDPRVAGQYPCVVETNLQLLRGGAYLQRLQDARRCCRGTAGTDVEAAAAVARALDAEEVACYAPGDKPLRA
jgi:hypothetical protein